MEHNSSVVREVANLFERAENQANAIDAQKATLIELREQLKNKYSTETHVLVEREVLEDLSMDNIESCANDILSEAEYHDARSFRDTAMDCISKIEDILDPMPEEEPVDVHNDPNYNIDK